MTRKLTVLREIQRLVGARCAERLCLILQEEHRVTEGDDESHCFISTFDSPVLVVH